VAEEEAEAEVSWVELKCNTNILYSQTLYFDKCTNFEPN